MKIRIHKYLMMLLIYRDLKIVSIGRNNEQYVCLQELSEAEWR